MDVVTPGPFSFVTAKLNEGVIIMTMCGFFPVIMHVEILAEWYL